MNVIKKERKEKSELAESKICADRSTVCVGGAVPVPARRTTARISANFAKEETTYLELQLCVERTSC